MHLQKFERLGQSHSHATAENEGLSHENIKVYEALNGFKSRYIVKQAREISRACF